MLSRTDADRWDTYCICNLPRDVGEHDLQHHTECTSSFYRVCIGKQTFGLRLRPALDSVAAFLTHTLRQHADVRHKGNPGLRDRLDVCHVAHAALQLHRLRASIDKFP